MMHPEPLSDPILTEYPTWPSGDLSAVNGTFRTLRSMYRNLVLVSLLEPQLATYIMDIMDIMGSSMDN